MPTSKEVKIVCLNCGKSMTGTFKRVVDYPGTAAEAHYEFESLRAEKDGLFDEDETRVKKAVRDLCPKAGSGVDSVTLSIPGHDPVPLTPETRERLTEELRRTGPGQVEVESNDEPLESPE